MSDDESPEVRTLRALVTNQTIRPAGGFNADVAKRIANGVAGGLFLEHACPLAGVDPRVGAEWFEKGRSGEMPYDLLYRLVVEAEAKFAGSCVIAVHEAGPGMMAKMLLLEKRFPALYGKPMPPAKGAKAGGGEMAATGTDGKPTRVRLVGLDKLDDRELDKVHDIGEAARRKRKRRDGDEP